MIIGIYSPWSPRQDNAAVFSGEKIAHSGTGTLVIYASGRGVTDPDLLPTYQNCIRDIVMFGMSTLRSLHRPSNTILTASGYTRHSSSNTRCPSVSTVSPSSTGTER